RTEHLRRNTDMTTHADTNHRHLGYLGVALHTGSADMIFHAGIQYVHRLGIITAWHSEGKISFTFNRLVLDDHVDFDIGISDRPQDLIGNAWPIRYTKYCDLGFVAIECNAGDGSLFHV